MGLPSSTRPFLPSYSLLPPPLFPPLSPPLIPPLPPPKRAAFESTQICLFPASLTPFPSCNAGQPRVIHPRGRCPAASKHRVGLPRLFSAYLSLPSIFPSRRNAGQPCALHARRRRPAASKCRMGLLSHLLSLLPCFPLSPSRNAGQPRAFHPRGRRITASERSVGLPRRNQVGWDRLGEIPLANGLPDPEPMAQPGQQATQRG
ncbi:unnamed protein product [Closterium sp. NIES-53]